MVCSPLCIKMLKSNKGRKSQGGKEINNKTIPTEIEKSDKGWPSFLVRMRNTGRDNCV